MVTTAANQDCAGMNGCTNNANNEKAVVPTTTAIVAERAKSSLTFKEVVAPGLMVEVELRRILAGPVQSLYQKVEILDTYFGKTLVTDGKTQSTQFDEFAYHESLVHPPLLKAAALALELSLNADTSTTITESSTVITTTQTTSSKKNVPSPIKTVFVGGGGELATVREILRHPSVERVVMVDIDATVVELCQIHLPEWGGPTVASDPRLELIIGDAYNYLMNTTEQFDAIIMDISDPIEAGPGIMLYTQEFYKHTKTLLHPIHGVFCTQAGMAESVPAGFDTVAQNDPSCFAPIYNTLNTVFDCVIPYSSNIPSFGADWGFVMAFTNANVVNSIDNWSRISPRGMIDELIEQHINGGAQSLQWYDEITHYTMFNLAKPLRKYMSKDKRIMTKDNPIFMF